MRGPREDTQGCAELNLRRKRDRGSKHMSHEVPRTRDIGRGTTCQVWLPAGLLSDFNRSWTDESDAESDEDPLMLPRSSVGLWQGTVVEGQRDEWPAVQKPALYSTVRAQPPLQLTSEPAVVDPVLPAAVQTASTPSPSTLAPTTPPPDAQADCTIFLLFLSVRHSRCG